LTRRPTRRYLAFLIATLALGLATRQYPSVFPGLYHAPWIDAARATRLGALDLGYGFLWSDLVCYLVGAVGAAILDTVIRKHRAVASHR